MRKKFVNILINKIQETALNMKKKTLPKQHKQK